MTLDLHGSDPAELARLVKQMPDRDLEALMASDQREEVLHEVFSRAGTHLRADRAEGMDEVVHFKVWDRPEGGYDHYELVIRDGAGTVNTPPCEEPTLTIKLKPVHFLKLITGNADGRMLALRGKLRVQGDLGLAAKLSGLFDLPKA